jgi:hypothetical protein
LSDRREQEIADIARAIRRYLETHPQATDSVDGIARWWLLRQRYEKARADVQEALDGLEAAGVVARQAGSDGRVVYRLREGRPKGAESNDG